MTMWRDKIGNVGHGDLAKRLGVTALYLETGSDTVRCPHCGRNP